MKLRCRLFGHKPSNDGIWDFCEWCGRARYREASTKPQRWQKS